MIDNDTIVRIAKQIVKSRVAKTHIVKTKDGYCIKSTKNKHWNGGCYKTKEQAEDRNDQIAMFYHMNGGK